VGFLVCIQELRDGWDGWGWEVLHVMVLKSAFEVWDRCSENCTDERLFFTHKLCQSSYSCIIHKVTSDYLITRRT
jgi:hypothetical protein